MYEYICLQIMIVHMSTGFYYVSFERLIIVEKSRGSNVLIIDMFNHCYRVTLERVHVMEEAMLNIVERS